MHALARVLGVRGGTLPAAAPRSLRALGGLCQEDGAALEGSPRCPESCPAPCPGGALGFGSCSGWGGQQVRAGRGGTWDLALRGCPGLLVDLVWTQEEDQAGRGGALQAQAPGPDFREQGAQGVSWDAPAGSVSPEGLLPHFAALRGRGWPAVLAP